MAVLMKQVVGVAGLEKDATTHNSAGAAIEPIEDATVSLFSV